MGCFWIVLVILGFLAIVLGIREWRRRNAPPPNAAKPADMSRFVRDTLGSYLVLLAIFLSYSIYRLLAVEFPPDSNTTVQQTVSSAAATVNTGQAPGQSSTTSAAKPAGQSTPTPTPTPSPIPIVPIITKVVPNTADYYKMPQSITVSGRNFSSRSQVRINGNARTTELTGDGDLRAPMDKTLSAGTAYVEVTNDEAFSNSLPLQIVAYGKFSWCGYNFDIGPEARLLLLVLLAGALGSFIHALQSLVDFSGNATLKSSWAWWYIARPFIGMSLALVFYSALRGGLLAGTPSAVKDVNPYGIFTIGALAGMFSDKATQKLADVFDVLFKADDNRKDKLKKVSIKTSALPAGKVNAPYPAFQLEALDGASPYVWTASDLPPGLTANSGGIISGIPSGPAAKGSVKITVKDSTGDTESKNLDLVINA